ncbi:MAG TPA: histidinol dehydrogenase [Candidatus Sulfotelmatobacter sp.]|nr:histidinol dehydrogenase [Candidatus Sulfotelmatobacter sp.]
MRVLSGQRAVKMVERLAARATELTAREPRVRNIIKAVRSKGDRALRSYAERWDGLAKDQLLEVSDEEMADAWKALPAEMRRSLGVAARNIRRFCEWQKPRSWTRRHRGISLGQLAIPLESVGCYVPGGRYPLVSTLLMTVVPAQVAGVKHIRVVSPRPSTEVLAAAKLLGVRKLYRIGGAQAIAALAYGTKTIRRVDKIVGPGNAYVTAAKKLVSFDCAIDFLAGPTEAVVLSESGDPKFIAADLVSQAEHDPDALSIFITTNRTLAERVECNVKELAMKNPIAQSSLRRRGAILVSASREQAREWANALAPEHITVAREDVPYIRDAGSVFVGDYSPQAAGDYASGPNHVLPTAGQARFRGGLSVWDFMKLITVQELSREGLQQIGKTVQTLAQVEGLRAHAEAIRVRCVHA